MQESTDKQKLRNPAQKSRKQQILDNDVEIDDPINEPPPGA